VSHTGFFRLALTPDDAHESRNNFVWSPFAPYDVHISPNKKKFRGAAGREGWEGQGWVHGWAQGQEPRFGLTAGMHCTWVLTLKVVHKPPQGSYRVGGLWNALASKISR
jgi:hypothetical protein